MNNEEKTKTIHFRVTPREHAALHAMAKRAERNPSDMLRKLIRDAARREGVREESRR